MAYSGVLLKFGTTMQAVFNSRDDMVSPHLAGQLLVFYPIGSSIDKGDIRVLPSAAAKRDQPTGKYKLSNDPSANISIWHQVSGCIASKGGDCNMSHIRPGVKKAIIDNDQDFFKKLAYYTELQHRENGNKANVDLLIESFAEVQCSVDEQGEVKPPLKADLRKAFYEKATNYPDVEQKAAAFRDVLKHTGFMWLP